MPASECTLECWEHSNIRQEWTTLQWRQWMHWQCVVIRLSCNSPVGLSPFRFSCHLSSSGAAEWWGSDSSGLERVGGGGGGGGGGGRVWQSLAWEWQSLSRLCQKSPFPCQKVWTKVWIEPAKVWTTPAKVVNWCSHMPEKCESLWIDGEVFGMGGCTLAGDPSSRFTAGFENSHKLSQDPEYD